MLKQAPPAQPSTDHPVPSESHAEPSRFDWADWLLLGVACLIVLINLGTSVLWQSEGRWAEVTREMIQNRDYFHPAINGEPYFDKPLLTYWAIAGVSFLTGVLNEWVVRLPSAIAGLLAVWATLILGRRLWSAQTGRIAGWILLTTYGLIFWSRTAAADTENLAAIMLCVAWYWAKRDRPGFAVFLVFYLIMFLGALMKGLTAIAVPICVIVPDLLREQRWRMLFKPAHLAALAIGCLVYLAPLFYASMASHAGYQESGLSLVFRENIQRFVDPFDHKGPIYTYLIHLPVLFLPWTPLLIVSLVGLLRKWRHLDWETRWCLWATAIIFLLFTASGSRRSYYILPALPFCALFSAFFVTHTLNATLDRLRRFGLGIQEWLIGLALLAGLCSPLAGLFAASKKGFQVPTGFYSSSFLLSAGALIVWVLLTRLNDRRREYDRTACRLISIVTVTAVLMGGFFCRQMVLLDALRTERGFARTLAARSGKIAPENMGFFIRTDPIILFYLNRTAPVSLIAEGDTMERFLSLNQPRVFVSEKTFIGPELLSRLDRYPSLAEPVVPGSSRSEEGRKWVAWFLDEPVP